MTQDKTFEELMRSPHVRRITRRDMLRYTGAGAGAAGLAAFLAACGVGGADREVDSEAAADIWENAKEAGVVNFTNWPLYIDKERRGGEVVRPTLLDFTEATGIEVDYRELINEVDGFYATIEPALAAGEDTGHDIIVITNSQVLTQMIELGYLIPLEHSYLENFNAHAGDAYKDPSFDPDNKYTIPWQSGITGIGYDPNLTGREITSFQDLLDPAFKGKVGMFGDVLDLPNLALVGIGVNPEESTPDEWQEAADVLIKQRDDGIVRAYYTQNYINKLQSGEVALTMVWSGDVFQAKNSGSPQLEFIVPEEGGVIWTDNMCIPAKAEHPVDAITLMDFVYQPDIAAQITEWVNYITPVPECQSIVEQHAAEATGGDKKYLEGVASSPLVFPTQEIYDRTYRYRVLTPDEEEEWNSIFQPIYQA